MLEEPGCFPCLFGHVTLNTEGNMREKRRRREVLWQLFVDHLNWSPTILSKGRSVLLLSPGLKKCTVNAACSDALQQRQMILLSPLGGAC
ncbi:hypothetical protein AAFF_G00440220 [Aldrovandia affinis]|uniref:Uncharacterized protein n=1 Tax=Aldrovandia affinis TaxID=143900 RepID=A0AAD7S7E5_9TELE|nr:hypothetical protein AAFF_G00440220 [Aldrovandia affinis]